MLPSSSLVSGSVWFRGAGKRSSGRERNANASIARSWSMRSFNLYCSCLSFSFSLSRIRFSKVSYFLCRFSYVASEVSIGPYLSFRSCGTFRDGRTYFFSSSSLGSGPEAPCLSVTHAFEFRCFNSQLFSVCLKNIGSLEISFLCMYIDMIIA